ncbi:hypothetical protein [Rheinheimera sp.]|uniref:hypothetical protein n=1 Tax=Rheinheimera sp. TaxID=1869214 RepID=UPI0027BA5350|nr:hypothetical protein [Rheinheimera sp.]
MELVKRYVSAVARYLPEADKAAISRELDADIQDKIEHQAQQQGRVLSTDEIAALLQQWGNPRHVAAQYAPAQPLVSSELMPLYWQVLKFVLAVLFVLQLLQSGMSMLQAEHFKLLQFLLQLSFGFFDEVATAFMVVTLVFYSAAFGNPLAGWLLQQNWQVKDLPAVERPWQQIRLMDIFTDLVSSGFLLLLLWHPLWMSADTLASLRLVFSADFKVFMPLLSLLLLCSLLFSLWCWYRPYWQQTTLLLNVLQNLLYVLAFSWIGFLPQLVLATNNPLPRLLELSDINRVLQHGALLLACYLFYEVLRDLYRIRQLRQIKTDE